MHEFICQECEAEFTVEYDGIDTPGFCPFCGEKLRTEKTLYSDLEEDEDSAGC